MVCDPAAYTGFAVGRLTLDALAKQGAIITACVWRYGSVSARENPFEPHRRLAGEEITADTIGEGFDGFGWAPGDHKGCLCSIVPIVRDPQGRFAPRPEEIVQAPAPGIT